MKKYRGFSLIELLVVIAIIAIVTVAVLAAINPMEQIRKARDAAKLKDAAELVRGYGSYYAGFKCYPWYPDAPDCSEVDDSRLFVATVPDFSQTGVDYELITQGKLKEQFVNRRSIQGGEMLVSHNDQRVVSVCYEPESKNGRSGAFVPLMDNINQTPDADKRCDDLEGYPDNSCFICFSF